LSLAIDERALGPGHADTAVDYYNIGLGYREQGRYRPALGMQQKALAIRVEELGAEHPDTQETRQAIQNLCAKERDAPACAALKAVAPDPRAEKRPPK
jgi:tetratricopeptide (TPR) repeat protein